jgi:signal peptidase II
LTRINGTRLFGLTIIAVLLVDQLSKRVVRDTLAIGESFPSSDTLVGSVFSFTRVSNTGIAFGLFQGRSELFIATSLVVVAAILVYRTRLPADSRWLQIALGLQVGGAIGNIFDRLVLGHVTDFFDFKVWPVFNVSDLSIFIGVCMLAWYLWQEERRAAREAKQGGVSDAGDAAADSGDRPSETAYDRGAVPSANAVPTGGPTLSPALEERSD